MTRRLRGSLLAALAAVAGVATLALVIDVGTVIHMVPVTAMPGGVSPPGRHAAMAVVLGLVALIVVVVVGVGLVVFDLGGRREEEAQRLQTIIGQALQRELGRLPVLPVAQVPSSARSPVVVELTGRVPTADVRGEVLRVAEAQMSRLAPHHQIEDRLEVDESVTAA